MKRKIVAIIISLMLLVGLLPSTALATESESVAKIGDTEYTTLNEAMEKGITSDDSLTVEIIADIDLTGQDWTPVDLNYGHLTIEGNNHTITGMNASLINKTGSGGQFLKISNITFADCTSSNNSDYAAIICPYADSMNELTFNNVHIKNATVTSKNYGGAFVAYAAGYSRLSDGPVFQKITFNNCSVEGGTIIGVGSVGALIGHACGNDASNITVTDTTVSGVTVTCSGSSNNKAGSLFGTLGNAGMNTVDGLEGIPGIFVSATTTNNTVKSNGTAITTVYGRQGSSGGKITLTEGGSYDAKPIEDDKAYAVVSDGFELVEKSGVWTVRAPAPVAQIGNTGYLTLAAAVEAAENGDTITLLEDITLSDIIIVEKSVTIDLNEKTVTATGAAGCFEFEETASGFVLKNGTIKSGLTAAVEGDFVMAYDASGTYEDLVIDSAYYAAAIGASTNVEEYSDIKDKPFDGEIVCKNVKVQGPTRLFYSDYVPMTLIDCEATGTDADSSHFANSAICAAWGATVTVKSGTYSGKYVLSEMSSPAKIVVEDGNFTGILNDNGGVTGSYEGLGTHEWEIKGGTYTTDPSDYVAEGYKAVLKDNLYIVSKYVPAELKTDIAEKSFTAGSSDWVEFTFSTVANSDAGEMVYGGSDFGVTYEDKIAGLEYKAGDEWIDMKGHNFGEGNGFPMADATSTFRVKFTDDAAGDYTFKAAMKRVSDDAVVCELSVDFTVAEKPSVNPDPITPPPAPITPSPEPEPEIIFEDVEEDAFYYDAVYWAAENNITNGVDDTHFNPNGITTRGEVVTFLWRTAGCPEPASDVSFDDVPADAFYAKAVAWATENGIALGIGENMFAPEATCTRAHVVAFMYRYVMQSGRSTVNPFEDVSESDYFFDAVIWAVNAEITNGTSETTFSPNEDCMRLQVVTFLYRLMAD